MTTDPSLFTSVIERYLPEPHASLLNGMLFGIDLYQKGDFYDKIKSVGLLHIVVLSGMNISILSALVSSLTIRFGRYISFLLSILSIIIFVLFVKPEAPIVRAAIMGLLTSASFILGRKSIGLYSLLLALLLTALLWPRWLSTVSFQLSYGATLGIILFGQSKELSKPKSMFKRVSESLTKDIRISLSAQLFTAPIIFIYFKNISLIAPVSNLLVSFMVAPIMIVGIITSILGKIHWVLGLGPSYLSYGMLSWVIWVVETLSKLSFLYIQL